MSKKKEELDKRKQDKVTQEGKPRDKSTGKELKLEVDEHGVIKISGL